MESKLRFMNQSPKPQKAAFRRLWSLTNRKAIKSRKAPSKVYRRTISSKPPLRFSRALISTMKSSKLSHFWLTQSRSQGPAQSTNPTTTRRRIAQEMIPKSKEWTNKSKSNAKYACARFCSGIIQIWKAGTRDSRPRWSPNTKKDFSLTSEPSSSYL